MQTASSNDLLPYYYYIFVGFCVAILYLRVIHHSDTGTVRVIKSWQKSYACKCPWSTKVQSIYSNIYASLKYDPSLLFHSKFLVKISISRVVSHSVVVNFCLICVLFTPDCWANRGMEGYGRDLWHLSR